MKDKKEHSEREERLPQPGLDEEPGEEGGQGSAEESDRAPGEPTVEQPSRPALDPEGPGEEERHFDSQ